jgi:Ca2+-binding RTX toxin-like protein
MGKRVNSSDPNDLRVVLNDPGVEGLDNLNLTGSGDINGIGNKLANTIKGNNGSNRLEGLGGSDKLNGLSGSDTLIGYGSTLNERDELTGSYNNDVFVLGDSSRSFYTGDGDNGYAVITDYVWQDDRIQMKGSIGDYQWVETFFSGVGSSSVLDTAIYKGGDLIAVVQDQNSSSNGGFMPNYDVDFVA